MDSSKSRDIAITQDLATTTDGFYEYDSLSHAGPIERYLVPLVFGAIFICGIIGNGLVIFVVVCIRGGALRTVTNLYLVNLAVADLLMLVFCVPFTGVIYSLPSWPFGLHICKLVNYMMLVTMATSILTMTAMSIDRYCAVVIPIRTKVYRTVRRTHFILGFIWALNAIVLSPVAHISQLHSYGELNMPEYSFCLEVFSNKTGKQSFTMALFIAYYICPLAIIGVSYLLMSKKMWGSIRPGLPQDSTMKAIKRHRRICVMVMIMVSGFALCWLPTHVVHLYTDFGNPGYSMSLYIIKIFAHCFSYMNSALNPLIYSFMSHVFRQCCKVALTNCYGGCQGKTAAEKVFHAVRGNSSPKGKNSSQRSRSVAEKLTARDPCYDPRPSMPAKVTLISSDKGNGATTSKLSDVV